MNPTIAALVRTDGIQPRTAQSAWVTGIQAMNAIPVFRGNTPTEIRAGDNDVSFSVVQGGYTGFHNLDLNPTFKGLPAYSGSTWTSVTPEANGVQTTLTDSNASWTPGELSGLLLKPIASGSVLSYIIGNTATEIRIWGDVSGICNPGDDYEIYDFHLDAGSPCIDAANGFEAPELDIEMNPRVDDPGTEPNSGIGIPPYVDIGAYEYQP